MSHFLKVVLVKSVQRVCQILNQKNKVVVRLTGKNFSSFIAENEFVMVNFYAPWCGWCQKLAPEYEAAAALLKGDGVAFAKVDADTERELAWKYGISGYPTLLWFAGGVRSKSYYGERKRDGFVKWDEDSKELFIASKLRPDLKFYQTSNPEVAKMFHINPETQHRVTVQIRKKDEGFMEFVILISLTLFWVSNPPSDNSSLLEKLYLGDLGQVVEGIFWPKPAGNELVVKQLVIYEKDEVMVEFARFMMVKEQGQETVG
ncbi:hypothetical protein COLO4_23668 [Corchorus olitorius]|uniref:Thioredoxin domain-containing protein n=1 Tax=Corchorus olitorius TaxID=93759 RepID=A0A1R3IFD9_9ROSI|nr:hypothetical protein COLO4_23668 [Corchorus olitorius]